MASAPNHMMDAAWALIPSFPPLILSHSRPPAPSVFTSSVSLFGNGGSLVQPPDVVCLPFLALTLYSHWHHIGQGSFFIPLFSFHLVILPPCCGLHWHTLSSIPGSFLYTATAKQTPGTLWSKQPASCAVAPSVDSLSREQSVPLLLLCFVLFLHPWDLHSPRWLPSDGCNVLEQWLGCFLQQEC